MGMIIMAFIAGLVIGGVIIRIVSRDKPIGTLRLDDSDPDSPPYLFLELSSNPDIIRQKKHVTLKVNLKSYISQQ